MFRIVPLIPSHLRWIAYSIGAALQAGAFYAPEAWRPYAWALGALAWLLAGWGAKLPAWMASRPILPATLAPIGLGALALLDKVGPSLLPMLPENVQGFAGLAYGVLALAVGKALPEPVKVESAPASDAVPPPGPAVSVSATCSLADAAAGLCK